MYHIYTKPNQNHRGPRPYRGKVIYLRKFVQFIGGFGRSFGNSWNWGGIKIPKYTIYKIFLNNKMNINSEENILSDMIDLNNESRWRLDKLKISLKKLRKENEELRYKNAKLEEKCLEYLRNNRYLDKKVYGDTVNFEGVSFHINDSEN